MAITSIADVILTIVSAKAITTSLVQSVDDPKLRQNLWLANMARYARLVKIGMSPNTMGKSAQMRLLFVLVVCHYNYIP